MRIILLLLAAGLLAGGEASRLELVLDGALGQSADDLAQPDRRKPLTILADRDGDGGWAPGLGHALTYDKALHRVRIAACREDGPRLDLDLEVLVRSDAWVEGCAARYRVQLRRDGAALAGTWQGTVSNGPAGPAELTGTAIGTLTPRRAAAPDFIPPQPGEHPRLLVRRAQIPALQARLGTPFGQALAARLAASRDPVNRSLMHVLTGDPAHAEAAWKAVDATLSETGGGWAAIGREWGYRAERVALAYDLCHDAWDADRRARCERWLDWIADKCLRRPWTLSTSVNITPGSNYMVVIWAGAGLAAHVLDAPPASTAPQGPLAAVRDVAAPAGWTPPAGLPTAPLLDDIMPAAWLACGPWPREAVTDDAALLAGLGGAAAPAIAPGATIAVVGVERAFRPLAGEDFYHCSLGKFTKGDALDLSAVLRPPGLPKEASYHQAGVLATVVEVEAERLVRWRGDEVAAEIAAAWISGVPLTHGDLLRLAPGRHPLVISYRSRELVCTPWGKMLAEPRLRTIPPAEAGRMVAARTFEQAVTAGFPPVADRDTEAVLWNRLNCQGSMGDGGFQAEGESYTLECHRPLLGYAVIHRQRTGEPLSARPDASHFAPRYAVTTVFGANLRAVNQTWGGGGGSIPADYLGRCLPLCPPEWRPDLLRFGLRSMGADDPAQAAERIARWDDSASLAWAFLHWPVDLAPATDDGALPRWWPTDKGLHAYRSGWRDGNDVVVQFQGKTGTGAGWSAAEAGSFQILGFGRAWAGRTLHDRGGGRDGENVVQLPGTDHAVGARSRLLWRDGDPATGHGSTTVDLSAIYRTAVAGADLKKKDYSGTGISGWRAFACDPSGATPIIVVSDEVAGAPAATWTMHVPLDDGMAVTAEAGGFAARAGDAALTGRILAPAGAVARIETVAGEKGRRFAAVRIDAPPGPVATFLVALVLHRGEAPAGAVATEGHTGVITIGGRRLRLDGNRLLWESH